MRRSISKSSRIDALAVLTAAAVAASSAVFAASPISADLQAKAEHYATMAAEYRARMRSDDKRAIVYFTLANYCERKAEQFRTAAPQAEEDLRPSHL